MSSLNPWPNPGRTFTLIAGSYGDGVGSLTDLILSLDHGHAMMSKQDAFHRLPLHWAVQRKLPVLSKQLSSHKSHHTDLLHVLDEDKHSPLMLAVLAKDLDVMKHLLEVELIYGVMVRVRIYLGSELDVGLRLRLQLR